MTVVVLAGPPAVGHDTVARAAGALHPRLAQVEVDLVRDMLCSHATVPRFGAEWEHDHRRSVRQSCLLAADFDREGLDVVITDLADPAALPLYRSLLGGVSSVRTVLLLARVETLLARDRVRDPDPHPDPEALAAWQGRIRALHAELASATDAYDVVLDNDGPGPAPTASALVALL